MKLLGNTKSKIPKEVNGENIPHLEISEVVSVNCNIVNNDYQQDSRIMYTFVPNESFGQLLDISLHKKWSMLLKIFSVNVNKSSVNCRFSHIFWRNR